MGACRSTAGGRRDHLSAGRWARSWGERAAASSFLLPFAAFPLRGCLCRPFADEALLVVIAADDAVPRPRVRRGHPRRGLRQERSQGEKKPALWFTKSPPLTEREAAAILETRVGVDA